MKTEADTIDPVAVNGIGTSPLRKEDWPLVRGEGTFIADFKRPGMVHAFVVRSPLAHARFTAIDRKAVLDHSRAHKSRDDLHRFRSSFTSKFKISCQRIVATKRLSDYCARGLYGIHLRFGTDEDGA